MSSQSALENYLNICNYSRIYRSSTQTPHNHGRRIVAQTRSSSEEHTPFAGVWRFYNRSADSVGHQTQPCHIEPWQSGQILGNNLRGAQV